MTLLDVPSPTATEFPLPLTTFVGRDRELEELVRLLASTRLLTLTGAGGSGKTRLAREAALRACASFTRVAWADLAPLTDPTLIAAQVATALHAPERVGAAPLEWIVTALGDDRILLVLDNCEHLVEPCAALTESLLRACPRVSILATSREALGVASETAWLVPPLAGSEAVQLFVERAQAALPSFTLSSAHAAAVEEICRRLDGLPLPIELAAARVRVLSPEQIARRLDDAFRLLTTGSRTALPRHRTLRATMDWSFGLLSAREQVLLRRLAVFAGSFTLDAAEVVAAGEPLEPEDILDGIAALVDKSLIVMEAGEGDARYRLLETVRQYGLEQLADADELDLFAQRHAEHFLAMIEADEPNLVGGSTTAALLSRLRLEHDNLRAAAAWSVADAARSELGLRFVGALFWYWYSLGQFREARRIADLGLALDAPADPRWRGRALLSSGLTALAQGDYPRAQQELHEAATLLREVGDVPAVGTALAKYGAALLLGDDLPGAVTALDDAMAFTAEHQAPPIALVFARFWRGWAALRAGDHERARTLFESNLAVGQALDLPTTRAHSLAILARIELARGHSERARALAAEALELEVAIDDGWGIAIALDAVVPIALRRGRIEDAARLLAAVESLRRRIAVALPGIAPAEREAMLAELRTRLGDRFDTLYADGAAFTTDEAVRLAFVELSRDTTELRATPAVDVNPAASANGSGEGRLRVQALGPLQVFADGRLVEPGAWGSARPRELLVYLLLHPDGRTKEQVGLAFWPDASPAQLRNNFHVTLHRLRKALGRAEWVLLAHDRYRVDPNVIEEFDVAVFEREVADARRSLKRQEEGATARLEQALARFRGDLLDGEPVGDWHLEHRDRLQRLYTDALMELGGRLWRDERYAKAADAYRRLLARDELHEEAVMALMRCHAALGERAQALRTFQRFAERLREELDAEPGIAATRLFEKLQQGATV